MQSAIMQGGYGYWRTDRYPIGGEFHRLAASIPVLLTGKRIDSGSFAGNVEFQVLDGVQGAKGWTGYTTEKAFTDLDWQKDESPCK